MRVTTLRGGVGQQVLGALALDQRERHGVDLGLALAELHPHDQHPRAERGARAGEWDAVGDRDVADRAGLAREPTPAGQEARDGALEHGAVAPPHQRVDGAAALDHRGAEVIRLLGLLAHALDGQPVEGVRSEGEQVGQLADGGESRLAEQLQRLGALESREVELDVLREARQVGDDQHRVVAVAAQVGEHAAVLGVQELQVAAAEQVVAAAQREHPPHPPQQRPAVLGLGLDVDRLVVELGVDDRRQEELLRVGTREAGVAVAGPLHRRAHAVAVAEVDVVAHPDLVAVVDERRARQRQHQGVHQLDLGPFVAEQGRQAPADAQVDARPVLGRVDPVHVVALLVGDHLQGQLVVVAQEQAPLAAVGDLRRLLEDVDDGVAVLHLDRHEQARHQREVERHVALVAVAEVLARVLGPLVGLGQEHAVGVVLVGVRAQLLQEPVGLGQVLAAGAVALVEVRDGVQAQPVHAELEPEVDERGQRTAHLGVVEVQVGLVRVEAVPVVLLGDRVPRPVGRLEVLEDDPRLAVALRVVAPHVEVAPAAAGGRAARALEPGVLVGGVVEHQLGDHAQAAVVRHPDEAGDVAHRPEVRVDGPVVGDVVAVVALRRRIERLQPDGRHAQVVQVVELRDQAPEVSDAVVVAVAEGPDVQLVDDRVAVPVRAVVRRGSRQARRHRA